MSAARDKFKCYALDLSLLAVTKKRPLQAQRSWNGAPRRICSEQSERNSDLCKVQSRKVHIGGLVASKANVIAIVTRSVNRVTEMVKGRMG